MKATIHRAFFLYQAHPIIDFKRIFVAAYGEVLSVASLCNAVKFQMPAHVLEPGQAYLTASEWSEVVQKVQASEDKMVEIVL
ncbi:MAG: hypothetical protein H6Q67_1781 [Firmicutes bacterium]|nr:hypothetical protein [Bacillota bacterium]